MAGRSEVQQSAAYVALTDGGKRVLALIGRAVERGGAVALSLERVMGEVGSPGQRCVNGFSIYTMNGRNCSGYSL
jgi:hypothetical protein